MSHRTGYSYAVYRNDSALFEGSEDIRAGGGYNGQCSDPLMPIRSGAGTLT